MKTSESVRLQGVQQTLLIPLWARAKESQKAHPLIVDRRAATILTELNVDVTRLDQAFDEVSQLSWAVRAKMMNEEIIRFLAQHPVATVVNLGAGLDTTFERIDNGRMHWYDLDLPEVIQVRQALIPETERSQCIPKSVLDSTCYDDIGKPQEGVFFLACGLLPYFRESEVRHLLTDLAIRFPGSELVFDTPSRLFMWVINWSVLRRSGMGRDALMRWGARSAAQVAKWDQRIHIVDDYPWFARVEMDATWSKDTVNTIKWTNRLHAFNIFHFRFGS
jgi:O-methyltransferase involved in polyketide biosynthesis